MYVFEALTRTISQVLAVSGEMSLFAGGSSGAAFADGDPLDARFSGTVQDMAFEAGKSSGKKVIEAKAK